MIIISVIYNEGIKSPSRSLTKDELEKTNNMPVHISETEYVYFESMREFESYPLPAEPEEQRKNAALEIIRNSTPEEINEIVDYLITPIKQKLQK